MDGDNKADALRLASQAARLLSLTLAGGEHTYTGIAWQEPLSWSNVYGARVEGLA